jgi:hypothetical protein
VCKASLARGRMQRRWLEAMLSEEGCASPDRTLSGKAKSYAGRYKQSFKHPLERAQAKGYTVLRIPGPKGGEWGATYWLK